MIQWEYLECTDRDFYDWKTAGIDQRIISSHKTFTQYLNHLGESGWEMIAYNQVSWTFKRPKESQHYRE